ncbi:MAG: hypothetical protein D6711_11220, partial [Chloroflexi bacterium]
MTFANKLASLLKRFNVVQQAKAMPEYIEGFIPGGYSGALNRIRQTPLREWTPFTSNSNVGHTIRSLTTDVVDKGIRGAVKFSPAYSAYRSFTSNPITPREYMKSGTDVARLIGATLMGPYNTIGSALIGGSLSKATGGDFTSGMFEGIKTGQQYGGLSRFTSPLVGRAVSKLPISGEVASRTIGGVAGAIEGIGQDLAVGNKPNALGIGMDFVAGAGGYGGEIPLQGGNAKAVVAKKHGLLKTIRKHRDGILDVIKRYETVSKEGVDLDTFIKNDIYLREDAEFLWKEIYGKNKKPPKSLGETVGQIYEAFTGVLTEANMRKKGIALGFANTEKNIENKPFNSIGDILKKKNIDVTTGDISIKDKAQSLL